MLCPSLPHFPRSACSLRPSKAGFARVWAVLSCLNRFPFPPDVPPSLPALGINVRPLDIRVALQPLLARGAKATALHPVSDPFDTLVAKEVAALGDRQVMNVVQTDPASERDTRAVDLRVWGVERWAAGGGLKYVCGAYPQGS